jgi:predicted esterase YcpF (UPF0227 family)
MFKGASMAIIYLHGFGSAGTSSKVDLLQGSFPDWSVVAPNLSPAPKAAIAQILRTVETLADRGERKLLFVGTSLGGFYSWYLSAMLQVPAVMINPALRPHETTGRWVGRNTNYATGESFEWKQDFLDDLREMAEFAESKYDPELITVAVALDDELLDSRETIRFFGSSAQVHAFDEGGHRFSNLRGVLPYIRQAYEDIRKEPKIQ